MSREGRGSFCSRGSGGAIGVGLLLIRPPRGTDDTTSGLSADALVESIRFIRPWSTAESIGARYTRLAGCPQSAQSSCCGAVPTGKACSAGPWSAQL